MPFTQSSVIEIVVRGQSASGQSVVNVFHYRDKLANPITYANTDLAAAVADFQAAWDLNILPLLSADYKVIGYRGRAYTGTQVAEFPPPATELVVGEQFDLVGGAGEVGGKAGVVAPSFTAFGIQKLTDKAGRNYRGSFRLGTIQEIDVTANLLTGAVLTAVQNGTTAFVLTELMLQFDVVPWVLCVFSKTLALEETPPFTDLRSRTAGVTGVRVNQFVTSQVSRKQSLTRPT